MTFLIPNFSTVIQLAVAFNFACIALTITDRANIALFDKIFVIKTLVAETFAIIIARLYILKDDLNTNRKYRYKIQDLETRKSQHLDTIDILTNKIGASKDVITEELKKKYRSNNIEQIGLSFGLLGIIQLFCIAFYKFNFVSDFLINLNGITLFICIILYLWNKHKKLKLSFLHVIYGWIMTLGIALILTTIANLTPFFTSNKVIINTLILSTPIISYFGFIRYLFHYSYHYKLRMPSYVKKHNEWIEYSQKIKEIESLIKDINFLSSKRSFDLEIGPKK